MAYTLSRPRSLILLLAVNVSVIGILMWITYSTAWGALVFFVCVPIVMVFLALFTHIVMMRTVGPVMSQLVKDAGRHST